MATDCHILPPKVKGKLKGYLQIQIINIILPEELRSNFLIIIKWWGEEDGNYIDFPENETTSEIISYQIRTSFNLFREYLLDSIAPVIIFQYANNDEIFGKCSLTNILNVLSEKPVQMTFPIIRNNENSRSSSLSSNSPSSPIGYITVNLKTEWLSLIKESLNPRSNMSNNTPFKYQITRLKNISSLQLFVEKLTFLKKTDITKGATYFIEFRLPERFLNRSIRLYDATIKRFCSKRVFGSGIIFGNWYTYSLPPMPSQRLAGLLSRQLILWKVYIRRPCERLPQLIGQASLSMAPLLAGQGDYRAKLTLEPNAKCQLHLVYRLSSLPSEDITETNLEKECPSSENDERGEEDLSLRTRSQASQTDVTYVMKYKMKSFLEKSTQNETFIKSSEDSTLEKFPVLLENKKSSIQTPIKKKTIIESKLPELQKEINPKMDSYSDLFITSKQLSCLNSSSKIEDKDRENLSDSINDILPHFNQDSSSKRNSYISTNNSESSNTDKIHVNKKESGKIFGPNTIDFHELDQDPIKLKNDHLSITKLPPLSKNNSHSHTHENERDLITFDDYNSQKQVNNNNNNNNDKIDDIFGDLALKLHQLKKNNEKKSEISTKTKTSSESTFWVNIEIDRAYHLTSDSGEIEKRRCYACIQTWDDEDVDHKHFITTGCSNKIRKLGNPIWEFSTKLQLPISYLLKQEKQLTIQVYVQSSRLAIADPEHDELIGISRIDMTPLTLGFPFLEGCFNILDDENKIRGQLTVKIIPAEDISGFSKLLYKNKIYFKEPLSYSSCSNSKPSGTAKTGSTVEHPTGNAALFNDKKDFSSNIEETAFQDLRFPDNLSLSSTPSTCPKKGNMNQVQKRMVDDFSSDFFLPEALRLKLLELDEITSRLKSRLELVTNSDIFEPNLEPGLHDSSSTSSDTFGDDSNKSSPASKTNSPQENHRIRGATNPTHKERNKKCNKSRAKKEALRKAKRESEAEENKNINSKEENENEAELAEFDRITKLLMDSAKVDIENVLNPLLIQHLVVSQKNPNASADESTSTSNSPISSQQRMLQSNHISRQTPEGAHHTSSIHSLRTHQQISQVDEKNKQLNISHSSSGSSSSPQNPSSSSGRRSAASRRERAHRRHQRQQQQQHTRSIDSLDDQTESSGSHMKSLLD